MPCAEVTAALRVFRDAHSSQVVATRADRRAAYAPPVTTCGSKALA